MTDKLFETSADLVLSGITPGLLPNQSPLWVDASSVIFTEGVACSNRAKRELFTYSGQPLDLALTYFDGERIAYVGTTQEVRKYIDGVGSSRLLLGNFSKWSLLPWGDWLIASNGYDKVQVSKGAAFADLAGTTFIKARILDKLFNYVLAINTSNGPNRIEWCTLDNPEVWTPTSSNTAGYQDVRDVDSEFIATAGLNRQLAVYSYDSMTQVSYSTDKDVVMAIQPAVYGIGAVSQRSVISEGRLNWGLARRGVWKTDGMTKVYVDEPRVRKVLRELVDWDQQQYIYGFHDEASHLMCWALPMLDGSFKTIGYDYVGDSWTYSYPGVYVGGEEGIFPGMVLGEDTSAQLIGFGEVPTSSLQSKPLDCGGRETRKLFQSVQLDIEADDGVEVKFGFVDSVFDEVVFEQSYAAAEIINLYQREAVAMAIRIEAPAGKTWRLGGFRVYGTETGQQI